MKYIHILGSIAYTVFGALVLNQLIKLPINSRYCYILVLAPIIYIATQGIGVIENIKQNEKIIFLDMFFSSLPILVTWDSPSLFTLPQHLTLFKVGYTSIAIVDLFVFTVLSLKITKNSTHIYNN